MNATSKHWRSVIGSITMAVLLQPMVNARGSSATMTVKTVSVEASHIAKRITATGNVVAWREIPIATEASGVSVSDILVDENEIVAKGQVLVRLNDDQIAAEFAKQKAVIFELEAALVNARSDAGRARLVTPGTISAQTIELRETLVRTTEAKLEAAQAQQVQIEARHRQMTVVAPAAGIIASRAVTTGQVIQSGTELFRLIQDSRIEVDARVLESDLLAMAVGQSVMIVGPGGIQEEGRVRMVSPIVDPKTRLGTVRVMLPANSKLKPGMFARVEISAESRLALTAPLKALVWRDAKAHVFKIASGNVVSLAEIGIGQLGGSSVEILSGVGAGERIVTEGAGLLSDGDVVNVETASVRNPVQ
ncbi:efflux RND transporter periplasmic adaptor subunit [Tardiphaga sp. 172_B4_N1_3]|uniref:efflux RND transporter periplasmic adaptor subunit n=1 Tax=Tardiphaga sp. 172_B4_N1_3 TaxID=3240787 RepID=UPI003F8B1C74